MTELLVALAKLLSELLDPQSEDVSEMMLYEVIRHANDELARRKFNVGNG